MAKHLLDDAQIGAVAEQVRGKTVSQKVRINVRCQAGLFGVFLHNLPDAHCRHFGSAGGKKNFVASTAAHQFWPLDRKVSRKRLARFAPDRHQARFTALADHPQDAVFRVEIFQPSIRQFGNAQTTGVEQLDHGAITQTQRGSGIDCLKKLFDLNFVQCLRQISLDPRKGKCLGRIAPDQFFPQKKTEKNLKRDHDQLDR